MSIAGETLTDDDGIWIEIADHRCRPRRGRRAALFLDRDGVIVEDTGFLSREADVRLVAGANRLGVPVIIVSNQSGIGRGFFDWAAFARVQTRIAALLARDAASIDAVLACPHHPPKRLTPIRTHRGASRIRECC